MGKKAIRKIVVVWFAGLATFGVLANDLLHVSAPILAVELDGSYALPANPEPVAPNSVSSFAKISEVETNLTVVAPSPLAQIPAAEEIQEPVAVAPELEGKSDEAEAIREIEKQIPNRSMLFTSDWVDISPSKIERVGFSPVDTKAASRERLAPGSDVRTLPIAGLERAKPSVRSQVPVLPALKTSRPLLFGTIVNRRGPTQPARLALSALPQYRAETDSAKNADAKVDRWVAVKHEVKASLNFAANALHASTLIVPARTAAPRQFSPIREGRNAIDLNVFPRLATRSAPMEFSVIPSISELRTSSPILEGLSAIDLAVSARRPARPAPMEFSVTPSISELRLSSPILDGLSAIDLNVFPRLATRSAPMEVSVVPLISVMHEWESQPRFAVNASPTSWLPILDGTNTIDLSVFPRVAPSAAPIDPLPVISTVTHKSTPQEIFNLASLSLASSLLEGRNAIDLSVSAKAALPPLPVSVLSMISPVRVDPILAGRNAVGLSVFPKVVLAPAPVSVSAVSPVKVEPILAGRNAVGLSVFPKVVLAPVPVNALSTVLPVKVNPILEGWNAIGQSVFPKVALAPVPSSILSAISPVNDESKSLQIFSTKVSPASSPILQGPSAIDLTVFPRLAMKSLPVLPVAVPYSIVSNDTRTASVSASHGPVPVVISGQTAFSQAMLRPLESASQHSSVSVADSYIASNRGPSADLFTNGLETRRSELERAKLPTAPSSFLITGQAGFSTEMLKPLNPNRVQAKPFNVSTPLPIVSSSGMPKQVAGYCDPGFVGEPIRFSQTVELKLEDLLNQLNARFGINFIIGQNVGKIPLNVKAGSIPWNILLKSQLFVSGVRARCIDPTTIELVLNRDLPTLQDEGAVTTRFVKLKYFQRTSGGTVDLANRSQGGQNGGQGGCGGGGGSQSGGLSSGGGGGSGGSQAGQTAGQMGNNRFDQLILEIEKILGIRPMVGGGSGGGNRETEETRTNRFVTQVPGRNILVIRASDEEHELIDQIIARADRPPFQVVIKGLVYSANQDLLRDIGVQSSIRGGNGNGRTSGGVLGDTLGVGTLFDFSTIIGTFDFNVQMTALQQNGVISVKSRPFSTVLDGLCTTLSVGTKLPIVIDSTLGGQGGITILNADNLLQITPYVVDDENGNPVAVTLEVHLQANVIDSSITARGVPAVNSKDIQTQLLLAENKTAILGGFSIDQDSKSFSKVPGLGDIPILGELFKRRIRDKRLSRLYFAISVDVIPYPEAIAPVVVPGATTDPQTITEEMRKRAEEAEAIPKKKKKDN